MSFTVDIYYLIINTSFLVENEIIMDFTLMLNKTTYNIENNLFSLSVNLINTTIVSSHFRLSNGGIQTFVFQAMIETLDGNENVAIYRGSIRIVNSASFPLTNGDFRFQASVLSFLTGQLETAEAQVVYTVIIPGMLVVRTLPLAKINIYNFSNNVMG